MLQYIAMYSQHNWTNTAYFTAMNQHEFVIKEVVRRLKARYMNRSLSDYYEILKSEFFGPGYHITHIQHEPRFCDDIDSNSNHKHNSKKRKGKGKGKNTNNKLGLDEGELQKHLDQYNDIVRARFRDLMLQYRHSHFAMGLQQLDEIAIQW